jgi:serine O-acetyltransferase
MSSDALSRQLLEDALQVKRNEPELALLLERTVLASHQPDDAAAAVYSFEDAVACTVCYRLLLQPCNNPPTSRDPPTTEKNGHGSSSSINSSLSPTLFCPNSLRALIRSSMDDTTVLELGHTMSHAIREDAHAVVQRDPAVNSILEVVLFSKGFASLVCHRAAHRLWHRRKKFTALFLQSQASAVFGVDIHPLTRIGCGIMIDHATGVVMGETATVGDGCTILHGVTLGGTGKDHGDRHPKVGSHVLIGANASLLGNIHVGLGAKIGAGSVVLRSIPPHATAVGAPAKIIGRSQEENPGDSMDETLRNVSLLHKSVSAATMSATASETSSLSDVDIINGHNSSSNNHDDSVNDDLCPFREMAHLAKSAPAGTLTICKLGSMLKKFGSSSCEIGSTFFQLDTRNVGFVKRDAFRKTGVEAIVQNTNLNRATAQQVVESFAG